MRAAAAGLAFFLGFVLFAQAPAADDIIRVTTNLVQLDAVVTDNRGNLVTDLKVEDFEILQDGKPQPISNFSFVDMSAPLPPAPAGSRSAKSVQRANVRRSIALVVDDLRTDWIDLINVRNALRQYVDKQILPGDLVSLTFTNSQTGALAQFTTNHDVLKAAIGRIKPNSTALQDLNGTQAYEQFSMRALQGIIDAMAALPGRKSIAFFSPAPDRRDPLDPASAGTFSALSLSQQLIGRANNSGVNLYPIDVRRATAILNSRPAIDQSGGGAAPNYAQLEAAARGPAVLDFQNGLGDETTWAQLASGTGGLYQGRGPTVGQAINKVLEDQGSYYLLGYRPSEDSFDRKLHKIEVKVSRPGLKVRTHTDFIAEPPPPSTGSNLDILSRVLDSPFDATSVRAKIWPVFSTGGKEPQIASAVFVDGRDLQFERLDDGTYRGGLEFILKTVDMNGLESAESKQGFRLRLNKEGWTKISQTGVSYVIPHPATGPGLYQVRMAVRDVVSGELGSASQVFQVPDLKKKQMALSTLLVRAPEVDTGANPLSAPATRVFERGRSLEWMAEVYHPKADAQSKALPQLYASVRLYRDGKLVTELPYQALESKEMAAGNAFARGTVPLNKNMEPGDYVMELLVIDQPPSQKTKPAVQQIDLEVI